jgi:O-antigen/teichoic acid export membrane protein
MKIKAKLSEFYSVSFGQIGVAIISLLLVKVVTEYLTPSEFGEVALAMTIVALVAQVFMGGVNNGIARYYSIAKKANSLYSYSLAVRVLTSRVSLIVGILGTSLVAYFYLSDQYEMAIFALIITPFSILNSYNSIFNNLLTISRI